MNESKMIQTLAAVEDERAKFAQKIPGAIGFNMGDWFTPDGVDEATDVCGTVGCLAGHAVAMEGHNLMKMRQDQIATLGGKILELDGQEDTEEWDVFYLDNLEQVYRWVADNMGVDEQVLRDKVQVERKFR